MKKAIVLTACLLAASPAYAQDAIGYVKTATGEASVVTSGNSVKAAPGTAVFLGSVLQTGSQSSLGVTFKDETIMSFGENTQLTVDEYLYAPAGGQSNKLSGKLAKGTLNYVSGMIAKLRPEGVAIGVPSGVIGVRGTQFLVKVAQ
jgi:hypothetical protein